MLWQATVLTAPRPRSTLEDTLASLARAGFEDVTVHREETPRGHFRGWMTALRRSVERRPEADAYLVAEDDVACCRGLREYLEKTLWPGLDNTAIASPYCPECYRPRAKTPGWHPENRGLYLVATQCWVIAPAAAYRILADLAPLAIARNADFMVGHWARLFDWQVFYHWPSLLDHRGLDNSALGDNLDTELRRAADFIGEDSSP